jgi:hypothetical protein
MTGSQRNAVILPALPAAAQKTDKILELDFASGDRVYGSV